MKDQEDKLPDPAQWNPGVARGKLVHEWTRAEKAKRERIRLRWPRLAELLDTLAAAS